MPPLLTPVSSPQYIAPVDGPYRHGYAALPLY
jgi:hypothetical protein